MEVKTTDLPTRIATWSAVAALAVAAAFAPGTSLLAEDRSWFVSYEGIYVAQNTKRSDVTQLVDGGTVSTDGFSELVFSFGGEFKERIPRGGGIGAILLPDVDLVDELLRNEGHFAFPLEVKFDAAGLSKHVFISPQQTAKVGFPRYRIYLYNETDSAANVSLYVYRSRR